MPSEEKSPSSDKEEISAEKKREELWKTYKVEISLIRCKATSTEDEKTTKSSKTKGETLK